MLAAASKVCQHANDNQLLIKLEMVERLIGLRPMMTMIELRGKRYYSKSIYAPLAAGFRFIKPLKRGSLFRCTQILEQLALSSALKGFFNLGVRV